MIKGPQIGIDRRIRLEWLEQTAKLLLAGLSENEINAALLTKVSSSLSVGKSTVKRGSGEKAVTNLMKIWVRVPPTLYPLRDEGLKLFKLTPQQFHIVLHWGMTTAVYPFWESVAAQTGRLLKLQGKVSPSQVQRRLKEQYGERPTVKDACRRVLRSMHDWGVLKDTPQKGFFQESQALIISEPSLGAWLLESLLHTYKSHQATLASMIQSPSLFPFELFGITANNICNVSPRIEIFHQNLDDAIIVLKNINKEGRA